MVLMQYSVSTVGPQLNWYRADCLLHRMSSVVTTVRHLTMLFVKFVNHFLAMCHAFATSDFALFKYYVSDIIDYPRSGVVYNFDPVCVCVYVGR